MSMPIKVAPRKQIHRDFIFVLRAEPIPAELRPDWRIALITIMLRKCGWAGSAPLRKLHLICSASLNEESRSMLLRILDGERNSEDVPIRVDPSLNRAVEYAVAEQLVEARVSSDTFVLKLLSKGIELADKILAETDCMEVEKSFANAIKGRLPNAKVDEILNWSI